MRILLSNDDGYNALGMKLLAEYIKSFSEFTIVAPKNNMSACSSSLSVQKDVKIKKTRESVYSVYGTSADSVHLALRGLLKKKYHQVISGINFGCNMGDDVIYSGTVAAAIEGRSCLYTPIAISIANREPRYTDDINKKLDLFLPKFLKIKLEDRNILNVNIPDVPINMIKGVRITKLGSRKISKKAKVSKDDQDIMYGAIGDVGSPKNSSVSSNNSLGLRIIH